MLERAVENWLAKASERSFQVPFCYMLAGEGYTVVHVSRHNAMELGKDVIAVDEDGTPCAFQLKGGNISLSKWREIQPQIVDLVYGSIPHPSVDSSKPYRAFLVTNGILEEEAQHAVDLFNEGSRKRGAPQLEVWTGGHLEKKAKNLQGDLWPSELVDARTLLELYLHDGRDVFPKAELAALLWSTLPFSEKANGAAPSKSACNRAISSAAVLTALALSSFTEKENHVAEVEAWTMYAAYALALAERWGLEPKHFEAEVGIALQAIENSLTDLAKEVEGRERMVEGSVMVDGPFYGIRVTWVMALLCILGLWRRAEGKEKDETDSGIGAFVHARRRALMLWGEAAVPQLLAVHWYEKHVEARPGSADRFLGSLLDSVVGARKPGSSVPLPDPHYGPEDWAPHVADAQLAGVVPPGLRVAKTPLTTLFAGYSYALEGLVHLCVQQSLKAELKMLWPSITRISMHRLEFEEPWHFYLWRAEEGTTRIVQPEHTKEWDGLKAEAGDTSGDGLPDLLRRYPVLALLFVCVYPHRANDTVLRWLNSALRKAK